MPAEVNILCTRADLRGGQVSAGETLYQVAADTGLLHRVTSDGIIDPVSGVTEADAADLLIDGRTWRKTDQPVKRAKVAPAGKTPRAQPDPPPAPVVVVSDEPVGRPGGEPWGGLGADPGTYASRFPDEIEGPNVLRAQEWYELAKDAGLPLEEKDVQLSKPDLIAKIRSLAAEYDRRLAATT